jgi:hypothetical protein
MSQSVAAPEIRILPEDRARVAGDCSIEDIVAAPPAASRALLPRRKLAAAAIVTAGIAASFALAGMGGEAAPSAEAALAVVAAPKQVWIDIAQPLQLYALPAPELDKKPRLYTARRHGAGTGRQDTLVFGSPDGREPHVRMNIYRAGAEAAPAPAFFVELARRAAEDGAAILRSGQPTPLETRFGGFEAADATLSGPRGEAACLGFRLMSDAPALRLSGFACGTDTTPLDRGALACILDRLDLVSAGEDIALRRFFVEAEQRRGAGCGPSRTGSGGKPQLRGTQNGIGPDKKAAKPNA